MKESLHQLCCKWGGIHKELPKLNTKKPKLSGNNWACKNEQINSPKRNINVSCVLLKHSTSPAIGELKNKTTLNFILAILER